MRRRSAWAFLALVVACTAHRDKIGFDVARLDDQGLVGPADGKRALSYEFCIPPGEAYEAQVRKIDPSVEIQRGSRGRIGCIEGRVLCVGNTHQPRFRDVLRRLAELPYVERIEEAVFE